MAAEPHKWLADYLNRHLGELEGLGDSKRDLKAARSWFNGLLEYFQARHLVKPKQQKNYLVDTRNEIRKRFGDSHPALEIVNFDEKTWFDINAATHARVEERNENTKPISRPFEIAQRAETLLTQKESTWADLAVGLGVATGRRISELLGARTTFAQKTDYSVLFTGQLKQQRETLTFEIPTLCPAARVVESWKRLRFMLGPVYLSPRRSNDKYGRECTQAANRHFADLVPPRHGEEDLYMHLFRAVYATIAVYFYCPQHINSTLFKAEIQGHRMVTDASTKRALRSYSASRHYNDYYVADSNGNVDGRQGVRLGGPGVQLLEVFKTPAPTPLPQAPTAPPAPPEPMPAPAAAKPVKRAPPPKPGKPAKAQPKQKSQKHTWKIPDSTYSRATKEWRMSDSEHLSEVFERVLAFAGAVKALASTFNLPVDQNAPESLAGALAERLESLSAQVDYEKSKERQLRIANNQLTEERDALSASVASLQSQLKVLEASAASPLALVPLARQLLELARKSAGLPLPELQASLMNLASDALSKFDGSTAPASPPPAQQPSPPAQHPPSAEAHPLTPTPTAAQAPETASPVVPTEPVAAAVAPVVVAQSRAKETPPDSTEKKEEVRQEEPQAAATATTNLNSAKAEAKLVKALDYLVAINDNSDNPAQKWVINESILASLTGCFRPAIKKFVEAKRSFINQANNTHGLGPGHNRGKARTNPDAIPVLVKNFKRDALNQPF